MYFLNLYTPTLVENVTWAYHGSTDEPDSPTSQLLAPDFLNIFEDYQYCNVEFFLNIKVVGSVIPRNV